MSSPEPSSSTTEPADRDRGRRNDPDGRTDPDGRNDPDRRNDPDGRTDPFREPAFVIAAYAASAVATWLVGPRAGLAALVVAATLLLIAGALHSPSSRVVPTFNDDLALILLYCCAAIGTGVLVVGAIT